MTSLAKTDTHAINTTEKKQPVPEVIACEQQGSCKMTALDLLQHAEKKENTRTTDAKPRHH